MWRGKRFIIILVFLVMSFFALPEARSFESLNYFSPEIRDMLLNNSFLVSITFRLGPNTLFNEDNNGNMINYGEFGPETMYDKEGNLLKEWIYEEGKLAYTVDYTDTGEIYTYYDQGKIVKQEWWGDPYLYDQDGDGDFDIYDLEVVAGADKLIWGEKGLIIARYHYRKDGTLEYVEEYVIDTDIEIPEGTQGEETTEEGETGGGEASQSEIKVVIKEVKVQRKYYDEAGRIQKVVDSEGHLIREYVYEKGILIKEVIYDYDKESESSKPTYEIHYIGGNRSYVTNENGVVIAQIHYDGAKISKITGTGEGMRVLGFDPGTDEGGLTLYFNEMGLPDYVENSEGGRREWLYRWDIEAIINGVEDQIKALCEAFGWYIDEISDAATVELIEQLAGWLLGILQNTHARLIAFVDWSIIPDFSASLAESADFEEFYNALTGEYSDEWEEFISALEEELGRSLTDDEIRDILLQLYIALITDELGIGGSIDIEIDGVTLTFSLKHSPDASANGTDGDDYAIFVTLNGREYELTTFYDCAFGDLPWMDDTTVELEVPHAGEEYVSRIVVLGMFTFDTSNVIPDAQTNANYNWGGALNNRASPTVTGQIYQDEEGNWRMRVYVWTGQGDPGNIHIDREFWELLNAAASGDEEAIKKLKEMGFDIGSQEEAQAYIEEINRRLEETGGELIIEEESIEIMLDISGLSSEEIAYLQEHIGEILVLHGTTPDGLIENGDILVIVGFGKWEYEPYHPVFD